MNDLRKDPLLNKWIAVLADSMPPEYYIKKSMPMIKALRQTPTAYYLMEMNMKRLQNCLPFEGELCRKAATR